MSTVEERRAYARGYKAGQVGRWPQGVPPMPDELTTRLAAAAKLARDILDGELAQMTEGDEPWTSRFNPAIDAVDEALAEIKAWMMSKVSESAREPRLPTTSEQLRQ